MVKDPAALLYIDKWIIATTEMKADARAYYMDLILFQFDKGSIPNDIEEMANICRVRFSEFNVFKQVFEQVLKQKFELNNDGRLENEFAKEIIQKRKRFIDKRSSAGKLSYLVKFATEHFKLNEAKIKFIKKNVDLTDLDLKNEQVLKQVLEQTLELYINEDEDENINKDVKEIYKWWNEKKIITHQKLTDEIRNKIKTKLKDYSINQLKTAIDNYSIIVKDEQYFFKYKWTLKDFLQRGIEKFLDLETAKSNYKSKPINSKRTIIEKDKQYENL